MSIVIIGYDLFSDLVREPGPNGSILYPILVRPNRFGIRGGICVSCDYGSDISYWFNT
uniref:Uncharacterized protein n=1 Tax=Helianthus annuus TaxID=4232 RepID=A0A251T8Q5_HELAN